MDAKLQNKRTLEVEAHGGDLSKSPFLVSIPKQVFVTFELYY